MYLNRTEYDPRRFDEPHRVWTDEDRRVIFEPRVWWQVVQINTAVTTAPPRRVALDQAFFRNGSRHKIVFTHALISPINYLLSEFQTTPVNAQTFQNCGSAISQVDWFLSAPQRMELSSHDVRSISMAPEPASDPSMRYTDTPYAASLFGLSRWSFDQPMWLPKLGRVQFDLSSSPSTAADVGLTVPQLQTAVVFDERWPDGGRFVRHARFRPRQNLTYATPGVPTVSWPANSQAFSPDLFPINSPGTAAMWDPSGSFLSAQWERREADMGAERTGYTGFAVLIDQIDHDDHVQTSAIADVPGSPITPFAQRLACRARCTNGGSGEWWWREGAPLALCCPTLGPAQVWRFDEPIMMAKADSFAVELQLPDLSALFSPPITPVYQVGFSLCGYAVVEG